MDVKHRELLTTNCQVLMKLINFSDELKCFLILRQIFTLPMLEDIMCKENEEKIIEELILELRTRGPSAFQKFLAILVDTGQKEAAAVLEGKTNNNIEEVKQRKHSKKQNEGVQLVVRKATEIKEGPKIFKMTSEPRGKCLIINNMYFNGLMKDRHGSEKDGMKLDIVFTQLGYDVKLRTDLKAEGMRKLLKIFTKDPEHKPLDSCVVIILSHGYSGLVYGVDGEKLYLEEIFNMFNNEECPALQGKPKMFFIQACRGGEYDIGAPKIESTDAGIVSPPPAEGKPRVPIISDMLITYSTLYGYVSIRDHMMGTWFCQELVDALLEDSCDEDVETILKRVDAKVQERVSTDGSKQATECIRRGWNRTLYFNPGL